MRTVRRSICAAVIVFSGFASFSFARAEDPSARELLNGGSLSIKPDDVRQMNTDAQSPEGDASTVTDLEATRAAVDRHVAPVLSLSVSGWVAEQVIVAH
jgi:hypothetical protein